MSELIPIKTLDREPFKDMVATIGNLPTSFVDSMSYFDMLAWLCKYIEEEIIPTVNSYAGAIEEVQALYLQLKEYVDNYFENLDVQEEINNKLDDMAESGQLAEIISMYLNTNAIMAYDTVDDLELAENVVSGTFARTYGKDEYNDGKGAFYKIRTIKNTDVIDGDNIVALPDETLVAEKMPDYRVSQLETSLTTTNSSVTEIKNTIKSVKDYGAVGDGTTDDTQAIVDALDDLEDGDKLYFPAGDYIIYSDYENNTTNPSYPLDKCLKLVDKKNITIFGDGEVSRIRPPLQGVAPSKLYFPTTLSIKGCEDIEIYGLTIESKGESYGDVDSASSVSSSQRPDFGITNGGHAILTMNSKGVVIHDIWARYCGSCGVVYFSSIENCIIRDSFINAASLGYACIAQDEFMYHSTTNNHYLLVDGCIMHKETRYQPENGSVQICSSSYSSKGGVYTEGAENTQLKCDVINCSISNCRGSSPNYSDGNAIAFAHTDGTIKNNVLRDTYNGIRVYTYNANQRVVIENNTMEVLWNGIVENSTINQASYIDVIGNTIVNANETPPETARSWLKFNAGIVQRTYVGVRWNILNNVITSKVGAYFVQWVSRTKMLGNVFTGVNFIRTFGGNFAIMNNDMICSGVPVIGISKEDQVVVETRFSFINNHVKCDAEANILQITQEQSLLKYVDIHGNALENCHIYVGSSLRPTNRKGEIAYAKCTANTVSGGVNTATFDMTGQDLTHYKFIVNNSKTLSSADSTSVSGNLITLTVSSSSTLFTVDTQYAFI